MSKDRTKDRSLLIHTDATVQMRTRHILRRMEPAQAWQDRGGSIIFASYDLCPVVRSWLNQGGFNPVGLNASAGSNDDAAETAAIAFQLEYL